MITCFYYRGIIRNSLDAGRALPVPAQNHIQKCLSCRKAYESEKRVVRELLGAAGTLQKSASPFLHARIMSSIARADRAVDFNQTRGKSIWAVGLAAACVIMAGVIWLRQPAPTTQPPQELVTHMYRPAQFPIDLTLGVKLPDGNQVRQWTGKLDEPLETEMKMVVGDAKTVINSLAENFLPEKMKNSLLEQEKGS